MEAKKIQELTSFQPLMPEPSIEEVMRTVEGLRHWIAPILNEPYIGKRGRPPYDPVSKFKGSLYRTRAGSLRQLSQSLDSNPRLFGVTGLPRYNGKVPPHQTFSNFLIRTGEDRLRRISALIVAQIREYWPDLGTVVSVDGTVVKAYANYDRGLFSKVDPDARWGYKEHGPSGKPKLEFGYRFTIASDPRYEFPLDAIPRPANASESPLYIVILKRIRNLGVPFEVVIADAQYDSKLNIEVTIAYHAAPVIQLNPRSSKTAKLTGTRKGDAILPIRRNSPEWKRYMAMRVGSEHVNSALKYHVGLNTLKNRRLPRVATFFWLCMVTKQLYALTAARIGRKDLSRSVLPWSYF